MRQCQTCKEMFHTIQECEVPLDMAAFAIKYPAYGSQKHSRKLVKIEQRKRWVA